MATKGKSPYAGGKMVVPRIRRLSWVQNLGDIALEEREMYIQELFEKGKTEVGDVLMKQDMRLSELSEEWNTRTEQRAIMDQQAYHTFLKKKLDELCKYLSANFTLALEEKHDLQEQKAMDSCIRIRKEFEVAFSAFQGQMQKVEYLMNEKPLERAKSDSIFFQLGQVQSEIVKIVGKADLEQSGIRAMVAKRVRDAKIEDDQRNAKIEAALTELNARMVNMQIQMQDERRGFQESKLLTESEKLNFQTDLERKLANLKVQMESNYYQDWNGSEASGITTVGDFKKLARARLANKKNFADIMALHSKKAAGIKIGLGNIPPFLSRARSYREFRENATHWRSLLGSEMRELVCCKFFMDTVGTNEPDSEVFEDLRLEWRRMQEGAITTRTFEQFLDCLADM